jgi:hypothetical protein
MNDLIERLRLGDGTSADHELLLEAADALEALAQPEQDSTYTYASNLAKTIWQKHYIKESPKFALLDTTEGVLTQIDNMTCGLVREKPAQPEQEPVAFDVWLQECESMTMAVRHGVKFLLMPEESAVRIGTAIQNATPPQRTWVDLSDEETETLIHRFDGDPHTLLDEVNARLKEKNT